MRSNVTKSDGNREPGRRGPQALADVPRERVASNAGDVFKEQVGGPTDVASGSGTDHFDVVTFPIHLVATDGARGCLRDRVEIGDGQPKGRIGVDRAT
jgi:hypothetical protein